MHFPRRRHNHPVGQSSTPSVDAALDYDMMREQANRLMHRYIVKYRETSDPSRQEAWDSLVRVKKAVSRVPSNDQHAIRDMRDQLSREEEYPSFNDRAY